MKQSPVLRASRRVRQHGLLRKLVLRRNRRKKGWVRQRANDRMRDGLGPSGAGSRGRARSRPRGARARRARWRWGREGSGAHGERRGARGGRLPRGGSLSRSAQRGRIRAYAQCSASCPWPSTRASSWAGSSFSSCERRRDEADAGGSATGPAAREVSRERGRRKEASGRERHPAGRSAGVSQISPHAHFLALRRGLHHVRLEVRLPLRGVLHLAGEEPSEPTHGVSNRSHRARARNAGGTARCRAERERKI